MRIKLLLLFLFVTLLLPHCSATNSPTIGALFLRPTSGSVPKGSTLHLLAVVNEADATNAPNLSWTSSNPQVASIDATGLLMALSEGTSSISVTNGSATASGTVTVTPAALKAITLTPTTPTIPKGMTLQLLATGRFTDETTKDLSATVTWTASSTNVTVSASGLATGATAGDATVTATQDAVAGSTLVTVAASPLRSIAVTPSAPSVAKGIAKQFVATGTFADNTSADLTAMATWASGTITVGTVDNATGPRGLVSTLAVGTTSVSAAVAEISGSTTLTVTPAELVTIAVAPPTASLAKGRTQQLTATGTFTDGTMQPLTATATWTSSNSTSVSVSDVAATKGLVSTPAMGMGRVTATFGTVSGFSDVTVTAPVVTSIAITPTSPSTIAGGTKQLTATGTYTDASTNNETATAAWASATMGVATVTNVMGGSKGLVTGVMVGTSQVTATLGTVVGTTTFAVVPPQACTVAEAEHPAYTTTTKDAALCGGLYTPANMATACGTGWHVCLVREWQARYPANGNPAGTTTTFGTSQATRCTGGVWQARQPTDATTWNSNVCNSGYNPYNNGKFLYANDGVTVQQGSGSCCSFDTSFGATGITTGYAVYCCL